MPETLTAPVAPEITGAPVTPVVPAPADPATPSLAEQLYGTTTTTPQAPTQPSAPGQESAPAPTDTTPVDGAQAADDAPEYIQGDDGRWRRADGTFATADELTQIEAQLAEADKAKAEADAARPLTVVPIRGRNGEMVEVEAPDEETAQLLRQNVNDGMRRKEYVEKMAEVETLQSELAEVRTMMATNPEAIILQMLPAEKQVSIAAHLLAHHFDALVPIIQGYDQNPSSRLAAVTEAQRAIREQQSTFEQTRAIQSRVAEIKTAVASLIPDTAPDEVQRKFAHLASLELTAAIDANPAAVTKDAVPQILASLLQHPDFSGFGIAAPAATARPRITLAKSGAAKPAASAAAPQAPANANHANQRLRLVQQRRNAAAIPPQGRGGPVKPAASPSDRAFTDAAHLLYGNTPRAR